MKSILPKLILGIFFCSTATFVPAQPSMQVADKQFENGDFERAALNYIDELPNTAEDSYTKNKIAACYAHMNKPQEAVDMYEEIIMNGRMQPNDEYLYAQNLKKLGHYNRAEKWFSKYAEYNHSKGQHFAKSCREAKKIDKSFERNLIFPASMNTKSNEFGPCVSPYGLVFNTIQDKSKDKCSYLLLTAEGEQASFEEPKKMDDRFEAPSDVVFVDYSPTGEKVLYTKITDKSCFNGIVANTGMAVYEADVTAKGLWENDRALPFNSLGYRTAYATYGETDDVIFYCTDQPSGFGGFDIYRSKRIEDRKWGTAQNMGPSINSSGDEISPKWNGKSLVFSSNWHSGLGGYDIFISEFHDNNFFKAVNAGRPINSNMDDWNMVFVDQESGYFTTNRNMQQTGTDIYYFEALKGRTSATPIFASMKEEVKEAKSSSENITMAFPLNWTQEEIANLEKTDPENVKVVFTVQVAVLNKQDPNFAPITEKLGDIDAIYKVFYDNVVKVRVGSYEKEEKAQMILEQVKSRGYNDAYIVKERMIIPTGNENTEQEEYTKPYAEGQYKVRLATYMHPEYFQREKVETLGEIFSIEKDPYTIFLLGHYDNLFQAREVLVKAKQNGFTNAQIVTQDGDELRRIE